LIVTILALAKFRCLVEASNNVPSRSKRMNSASISPPRIDRNGIFASRK
jgi:hypothetical protein